MQPWIPALAAALAAAPAIWWIRGRRHLDLNQALDAPWWLWPLKQVAIYWHFTRRAHHELYELCGWVGDKGQAIRVSWRYIIISQHKGRYKVVIRVHRGFPQGDDDDDPRQSRKAKVVNHARGSLGLGKVDADWLDRRWWPPRWRGRVVLIPKSVIPDEAKWHRDKDVRLAFGLATKDTVVPAIGKDDVPVEHSLATDAPHVLISASTMGGGKTTTLRTMAVQQYLNGAELLILDPIKKHSHKGWAFNPRTGKPWPGIVYADQLEDAARQLLRAKALMDVRNRQVADYKERGRKSPVYPRLVIVMDDTNGLELELKRQGYDTGRDALALLLWCGREVYINILAAFQRASALAAGGGDNRDMYGLRIVAEYQGSASNTNIVAPQAKLPPCVPFKDHPGWAVFVYGSTCFEAQRILIRDQDARRLCANHNRPALSEHIGQQDHHGGPRHPGTRRLPYRGPQKQPDHDHCTHDERQPEHGVADHGGNGSESDGGSELVHGSTVQLEPADIHEHPPRHQASEPGADGHPWGTDHRGHSGSDSQGDDCDTEDGGEHARIVPRYSVDGQPLDTPRTEGHHRTDVLHSRPLAVGAPGPSVHRFAEVSTLAIEGGQGAGPDDGGIEYRTLGEIAAMDWCPWSNPETLGRKLRGQRGTPGVEPAIRGSRNSPGRWSVRSVREWLEETQEDTGNPGVYVIDWSSDEVKIGETKNLQARLGDFAMLARGDDPVLHWLPCSSKGAGQQLEDWLHGKYGAQRVGRSEMFRKQGRLAEDLSSTDRLLAGCPWQLLRKVEVVA